MNIITMNHQITDDNEYIFTGAGNIFIRTNPAMIPFCTNLDVCIMSGFVEANHDRVEFDEDITCVGVYIPIVGILRKG